MVQNVSAAEAWRALKADPAARLVDVRTEAEWQFVGLPDLSGIGKEPLLIPGTDQQVNGAFAEDLRRHGVAVDRASASVAGCASSVSTTMRRRA